MQINDVGLDDFDAVEREHIRHLARTRHQPINEVIADLARDRLRELITQVFGDDRQDIFKH
jgi:hypothetical protein